MTLRARFIGALLCALTLSLAFLVLTITPTQHVASTKGERQQGHTQTFAHAEASDTPRQEVPTELRAAIEETRYRLERDETGTGEVGYLAQNPAQGWRARFDLDGLSIETHATGDEEARRLAMSLASYGYGETVVAVERPEVSAAGNRVEYRRGSLVEWYVNERRGVEQGFTINEPPAGARAQGKPLSLRLTVEGDLRAESSADGRSVGFVNAAGQRELLYDKLVAFDARGRNLSSRMRVEGSEVVLEVEDAGASYPLTIDPLLQTQKLLASDAAAADHFGNSISLSGDTAIIGAQTDDHAGGADAGSAYIFIRSGGVWTQQQKLTASDAAADNRFGYSVSVSGDTAVIGSIRAGNNGGQITGAAYVFTRSGGVWTQQQKLLAADGADEDHFGYSVSVSGDTTVISAFADDDGGDGSGSAYVFARSGGVWTQQQKLTASDSFGGDFFGRSVSLSGDTVIIGAWTDANASGFRVGSAYVFIRSGGVWTQQQKLTASDAAAGDLFGAAVSLSGDTAIIGAQTDDHAGGTDAGSAYIFTRSGGVWTQQQKLTASDAAAGDDFGVSVTVSGDTAIIGSVDVNNDAGAAYVFTRSVGVWTQQQKLTASDASTGDNFGSSISLSGDTVIVCAVSDDNNGGVDAGSAYVFISATANAAPVVNAGPDQTATEDVAFNLTAYFTDADASDNHTATVNWGDGSPAEAATVGEPSGPNPGTINAGHTYLAPGTYTVTVTVTDSANNAGSDTLQVLVGSCSPVNVALMTAGATATASSSYPNGNFPASAAIDGDRKGTNWGAGGGWNDGTRDAGPDWLQVEFAGARRVSEIRVFTLQDSFGSPVEPTPTTQMSLYGLKDYEVQYWDGVQWVTAGSVTNNVLVWRTFMLAGVTTTKVRVMVPVGGWRSYFARVTEVEVMGCTAP